MSSLAKRKTRLVFTTCEVIRERGRQREIVIEANPYTATVRLIGLRGAFEISWASIYNLAVSKQVERQRAEKKAARKERGRK